jgi:hypothetical protein
MNISSIKELLANKQVKYAAANSAYGSVSIKASLDGPYSGQVKNVS